MIYLYLFGLKSLFKSLFITQASTTTSSDQGSTTTSSSGPTTTPAPLEGQTALEHYISYKDDAYSWDSPSWTVHGNPSDSGLSDYAWIRLNSQRYLNSTWIAEGEIWKHNIMICAGNVQTNSDDVGMLWINGDGMSDDIAEYPRRNSEFKKLCDQAAQLGTVGAILHGIPKTVRFVGQDESWSEQLQSHGAAYYFSGDAPISAIAEFPEVKAVSMALDAIDEYLQQNGIRSKAITRWSITGGSKRGGVSLATAAADPRIAVIHPNVQNVFHAMPEVFLNDLNALGGYNSGWGTHFDDGWYHFWLTPSEKRNIAEYALNLNKHHKDRMTSIPTHFVLGSQDVMMHLDNVNVWWDQGWSSKQRTTMNILPNTGHSSGGDENTHPMHIYIQAMINNEIDQLPYLDWNYSDENTIRACILRPVSGLEVFVYRGVADQGRDFRGQGPKNQNIFQEVAFCDNVDGGGSNLECFDHQDNNISVSDVGGGCFEFTDNNSLPNGRYSAMWLTAEFQTNYQNRDGENYVFKQSSGPLIRPNTMPFSICSSIDDCDLTGVGRA